MSILRDGKQVRAFLGIQDGEPVVGLRISGEDSSSGAVLAIAEGRPALYLEDAEGNTQHVMPSPED